MKLTGCINAVAVHHNPCEVCSGIPSPECSQIQEMLSYTVFLYNSEISNIHRGEGLEGMCRGRVARKEYLIRNASGPDEMKCTWPK